MPGPGRPRPNPHPLGPGTPGGRGQPLPPRGPKPVYPATVAQPTPSLQGGGGSGGSGFGGGSPDANPELLTRGAGPMPQWVMRDFTAGMHVNPSRNAVAEQDLWWCENLQPLASGNLIPVSSPAAFGTGAPGGGAPYYVTEVTVGGAPKVFVCIGQSAYLIDPFTGTSTLIMNNLLNIIGQTYAITWTGTGFNNSGILIIDPNGYWDYNLTAANTLTSLSNTVTAATNTFRTSVAGGTALKQVVTAGGGTAGVFQAHYQVTNVTLNAAGTGYVPGDILSLTDNNPVTACQLTVTATGGGGAISSVTVSVPGDYPGPTTSGLVNVGPTGNVVTGGSGTGATFHTTIEEFKLVIVNPGHGFATPTTIANETATPTVIDSWSLTIGAMTGTSIATYAGRVWIGNANTINYTDINSYNSFAGAGGQATFSDQYLVGGITCLYPANNYLYIFGGVSVDVLSNVQVNATTGVTTFSRVNVILGLGVAYTSVMTVIGFNRGIVFQDTTGLYQLSGATPERISERIQAAIRNADFSGAGHLRPSCGLDDVNGELCLLFQFAVIPDAFSYTTNPNLNNRSLIFVYQRRRWWVHSTTYGNNLLSGPLSGIPSFANNFGAYAVVQDGGNNKLQKLLTAPGGPPGWQLRTKLWDGGNALTEKQSLNAAIACQWITPGPVQVTGLSFTIDTEFGSSLSAITLLPPQSTTVPPIPAQFMGQGAFYNPGSAYYALDVYRGTGAAQNWGSQFIGLTFLSDGTQVSRIELLALRGKQERNMME